MKRFVASLQVVLSRGLGSAVRGTGDKLPAHHGSVWDHMRDLLEAQPGGRTIRSKGVDPLLDGAPGTLGPGEVPMPNMLMDVARHTEFHNILRIRLQAEVANNQSGSFASLCESNPLLAKDALKKALGDSYDEMQRLYGATDDVSYDSMKTIAQSWIDHTIP